MIWSATYNTIREFTLSRSEKHFYRAYTREGAYTQSKACEREKVSLSAGAYTWRNMKSQNPDVMKI